MTISTGYRSYHLCFFQLPRREALSVSVIFAALDPRIYYCASGMSGARKSYHIMLYKSWTITINHFKDRRASYHILTAIFPQCLASNFKYRKHNFAVSFVILNCRKHIYGEPWTLFFLSALSFQIKRSTKYVHSKTLPEQVHIMIITIIAYNNTKGRSPEQE